MIAILDGAFDQFTRHGFAKSTMTDIASAAAVSRRALYNHFQTKEEVFGALSDRIRANVQKAIIAANQSQSTPADRLTAVVHARSAWIYDLLHKSEFAREFINERNRISGDEVRIANEQYERLISKIIKEMGHTAADASKAARILVQALSGILENANSDTSAKTDVTDFIRIYTAGLSAASC